MHREFRGTTLIAASADVWLLVDQIAQEAGFEEGIHGPPLNPRAQSWHLPTNSHHTLHGTFIVWT